MQFCLIWFGFSARNQNRTKPNHSVSKKKKTKLIRKLVVWFGFLFFFFLRFAVFRLGWFDFEHP